MCIRDSNITQAGTYYLRADSAGLSSACSNGITISEGSPAGIAFVQQPQAMLV